MAMSREEFLRSMGLSKDDVADPEIVVANRKEQKASGGAAQSAFFSRPRDKPYPGYASSTPAPTAPMSEAGQQKYDAYIKRVDNVTNDRVDEADKGYMPQVQSQRTSVTQGGKSPTSGHYASRSDWISKGVSGAMEEEDDGRGYQQQQSTPMREVRARAPIVPQEPEDDTESFLPKKKAGVDNISVAQRIAQSSLQFYGAGDEGEDDRPMPQKSKSAQPDERSRAEFLRSLGIDNANEVGANPQASKAISASISASTTMTGANRTEALSNAVAARRLQRKAALAAANANGGGVLVDETSYHPPRSAPSAVDVDTSRSNTRETKPQPLSREDHSSFNSNTAYAALPRASSEPSGDQCNHGKVSGNKARVTITSDVRVTSVPAYETERIPTGSSYANGATPVKPQGRSTPIYERERESPTKIVNEILYGGGANESTAPSSTRAPPVSTSSFMRSGGRSGVYNDDTSANSSLNTTMNSTLRSTVGGSSAAEYDPETTNLSAEELKTLGNKAFEDGDFRKAVRFYSKSIAKDPANAALYSNRSAAYLQASKQMGMDTKSMALRDAEKTIELRPDWFKGYSRKGDVLFKMEQYDDAVDAYELGLRYDEGNPSLMHSIGEARNANGGIVRRDKKDTPWAIEQRTNVDVRKTFGNKSAHELADINRGALNDALGTLVMGDEYRAQQLERFKSHREVRASGNGKPAAAAGMSSTYGSTTSSYAAKSGGAGGHTDNSTPARDPSANGGKSLLDMIRSDSPIQQTIPLNPNGSASPSGGVGYGRRAGKEPLPESLTSDAASAYQNHLMESYLARKAARGK